MNFFHRGFIKSFAVASLIAAFRAGASPFDTSTGVWTVSPAITSHYVFRGVEIAGTSLQPWVDYTIGPLSVGVWSSAALEHRVAGDSDPEFDLYGSYTFTKAEGAVSVIPGFYFYTYPDARRRNGLYTSTFEPSLAASFLIKGVQVTPKIYYDLMLEGATFELTAAVALPLKSLGTELDFSATAGTFKWNAATAEASPAVKNWGAYWTLGLAIPVQITLRSKLTLAVNYSEGRNNYYKQGSSPKERNLDAHAQTAVTLSYGFTL